MAETKKPKTKAELMAEKMREKQVGKTAFEAGKKPIIETEVPENAPEPAQERPEAAEVSKDIQTPESSKAAPIAAKEEPVEPVQEPASDSLPVTDILADLIPQKKKPRPETYGFYLDSDVHDELVKLAKANKTNKSRYLNALLRRVFFGE